jgi:hypothetical protein
MFKTRFEKPPDKPKEGTFWEKIFPPSGPEPKPEQKKEKK